MRGFRAVLRKEGLQMFRDKGTLRFSLMVPVFQLVLFGLIDTNVSHVPTVVFDQSRTPESRHLIDDFVNTSYFDVVELAPSRAALREAIVANRASVGVEIPPDYANRRLRGQKATFLVLIDGSDSSISAQALGAANGVALNRSLAEVARQKGVRELPLEARPTLLFNPDSRSANLLIPGLIAILLTFSGTLLSAYAIVRERERGTLEQLMVTPASPLAVVLGKILPYLALAFVQLLIVLALMRWVFGVPIHGSIPLLLGLAVIYLFALLSLGLLVSSRARTQMEATQIAQMILLPSIMLSGYIFPLSSLPAPLRVISQALPATHFIAISRGIVIRGASFYDLWHHVAALLAIAAVLVMGSARAFQKTIS
ncbi:MAG TPA: ABC transporter permease [Thermoanaerobaculia bacterium]|jgi:ABC-2 type transport system permease protein|nr:ABC transporter permease [Thermoanaerobaculia bacterium]